MQVIQEGKDEGDAISRADPIGVVLCVGRNSRCIERECIGKTRGKGVRIRDNGRIFSRNKERIW